MQEFLLERTRIRVGKSTGMRIKKAFRHTSKFDPFSWWSEHSYMTFFGEICACLAWRRARNCEQPSDRLTSANLRAAKWPDRLGLTIVQLLSACHVATFATSLVVPFYTRQLYVTRNTWPLWRKTMLLLLLLLLIIIFNEMINKPQSMRKMWNKQRTNW